MTCMGVRTSFRFSEGNSEGNFKDRSFNFRIHDFLSNLFSRLQDIKNLYLGMSGGSPQEGNLVPVRRR